jgi:WD40 repeat protein
MSDLVLRGIPFGTPFRGHADAVLWGAWGVVNDRPLLATGGRDGSVRLWDPATGEQIAEAVDGAGESTWGAWGLVDGQVALATGQSEGPVRIRRWARSRWETVSTAVDGLRGSVAGGWVRLGDQTALAVVDSTGPGLFHQASDSTHVYQASQSGQIVWGAWFDGCQPPLMATGGADGKVLFWGLDKDLPTDAGALAHRAVGAWGAWTEIGGRPVLATPGRRHAVLLWDPDRGRPVEHPFAGHTDVITWGGWGEAAGQVWLATAGADREIRIWEPTGRLQIGPLQGHGGAVNWGSWATIGGSAVLATGDAIGEVRLWDPLVGAPIGEPLPAEGSSLWGAWHALDSRPILATGGKDGTVLLWEVIEERPVGATLPPYRSDALTAVDQLDRTAEATAVAELVTARSARPPLAIGLFGEWGEGKSHFMALLQRQVSTAAGTHGVLAHRHVRQVRFNAWHYAETDLWASLVTELFAQLAAPQSGDAPIAQRQQSRLAAELIAQRGLPKCLEAARARRDELREALTRPERLWSALPEDQQARIRAVAGEKPEKLYAEAVRVATTVSTLSRLLRPSGLIARGAAVLLLLAAALAALVWWLPPVSRWWAALPVAAAIVAAAEGAVRLIGDVRRRSSKAWQAVMSFVVAQNQRLTTAADAADAEVAELERQMRDFTAAGQLAGVIAERAGSADYRSRLDVMSRIREDFARMARLLTPADGDPAADEVGDELPRIDRIVIYIDDLDRCPPGRVVEMLEAVHLLLAADLFVVVVAVDPRWLLSAISSHYRDVMTPRDGAGDPANPVQYLEKIFQVVLTLPPLDIGGYQRMLRGLVGTRSDDPAPTPMADSPPDPRPVGAATAAAEPIGHANAHHKDLPKPRVIDRVDPFALDPDEIRLLDLLGPPDLIGTPRQVKRLANSYGLLTALRRPHRAADLAPRAAAGTDGSCYPYRAGLVLLAALVRFPELGPNLLTDLYRAAAVDPTRAWTDFLAGAGQVGEALLAVADKAAAHGVPLPEPIGVWAEWIVPVGRLSFPAGRVVNAL